MGPFACAAHGPLPSSSTAPVTSGPNLWTAARVSSLSRMVSLFTRGMKLLSSFYLFPKDKDEDDKVV
jgi:hypothetical protein